MTKGEMFAAVWIAFLLLFIVGLLGLQVFKAVGTHRDETFTVNKSERIAEGKGGRYLIFTNKGVYENTDSLLNGKFNSSDVYAQIEKDKKYECDVIGWRFPFLSWYPNIIKCEEIK